MVSFVDDLRYAARALRPGHVSSGSSSARA
jgi:hypothetical protein